MSTYSPTLEQAKADGASVNAIAENSACVLVHNLPGTPQVAFSVYGQGDAYAIAVEIVEAFQQREFARAKGTNTGPEVSGQGPKPDNHVTPSNDSGHDPEAW